MQALIASLIVVATELIVLVTLAKVHASRDRYRFSLCAHVDDCRWMLR